MAQIFSNLKAGVDRRNFLLASAFGLGLSPILPGTCAAALGLLIHLGIMYLTPDVLHFWLVLLFFLLSSWLCLHLNSWAEAYWGRHDHQSFVLDEVAGYLCVPLLFSLSGGTEGMKSALLGFVLFRVLDMIKIYPANVVDKTWHNRWGVLVDDLISAVYATLVMHLWFWYAA